MASSDKQLDEQIAHTHKMRRILAWAVVCVSVLIAALWGFALRNRISNFSWNGTAEQAIIANARIQWEDAERLAVAGGKTIEEAKLEVKEKLAAILSAASLASSTTSSAALAPTSTDSFITSSEQIIAQ